MKGSKTLFKAHMELNRKGTVKELWLTLTRNI